MESCELDANTHIGLKGIEISVRVLFFILFNFFFCIQSCKGILVLLVAFHDVDIQT